MNDTLLWTAAVAGAGTAFGLAWFGATQVRRRGWGSWVLATVLAAMGMAGAASGQPALALPSALLLMQWPVVTLMGLRRFSAHLLLPLSAAVDRAVLAVGMALVAAAAALLLPDISGSLAVTAGVALVHLYAAAIVFAAPVGRSGLPLQWLGLAFALVALAPLPFTWSGPDVAVPLALRALAALPGLVVGALVAVTLAQERAERQRRDAERRQTGIAA